MDAEPKPGEVVEVHLAPGETLAQHAFKLPPKIPIGMVTLYDADGMRWQFDPQAGITSYELAMITNMAFKLTMNRDIGIPDWKGYLEEHKLTRHFKPAI